MKVVKKFPSYDYLRVGWVERELLFTELIIGATSKITDIYKENL